MVTLFVTTMVFLRLNFAFREHKRVQANDGWYVTVVNESILVLTISGHWRIVSFKRIYFVEKVGLLTLIILGKGIIRITKLIANIMQGISTILSDSISRVICSGLIIVSVFPEFLDTLIHSITVLPLHIIFR